MIEATAVGDYSLGRSPLPFKQPQKDSRRRQPQKDTQRNLDTKPINAVNDAELSNFFDRLGRTADSW